MNFRLARSTDLTGIETCARDAYALYVPRIGREPAPMIADFAAQITEGIVHVLEKDDDIVGFVVFYPRDDHMHLENVAVRQTAQGSGLGAQLLDFVEAQARIQKLAAVELYTNEKMTENIPYYVKHGYVEVARRSEDGFARVYFRKEL